MTCPVNAQYPYNWVLPTGDVFTFINGLSRIIRQDGEWRPLTDYPSPKQDMLQLCAVCACSHVRTRLT